MMTRFIDLIKRSRETFLDRHYGASDFFNFMFSGTAYANWKATQSLLQQYCHGQVLDAGSGRGAWQKTLERYADNYESLEMAPRGGHTPTWLGDITNMSELPADRFDTVFCHQVLEHVPEPQKALREIYRVLKAGGRLILTVPHLSRRHELPYDYYRYTPNGIEYLLGATGFKTEHLSGYGSIACFLHHQASFLFPGLLMGVPGIAEFAVAVNAPLSVGMAWLDKGIDRSCLMPLCIAAVGVKHA